MEAMEMQFNDFLHKHEFIVSYELKEITQYSPYKRWHIVQFTVPEDWEHINEIDMYMVSKGFKSFPIQNKLAYIRANN
jgi:hypothetical protein